MVAGAEAFHAERFAGRLTSEQHRAFLPFGAGHRKCIGEDLAMLTGVVTLAMLARRFTELRRADGHSGEEIRYAMTAPPRDNARLILTSAS